ncbi:MAG: hypothetical protein LBF91_07975, partial [Azoarcus sp.]|nr:hypothetical protein [Azoarcus sp.]
KSGIREGQRGSTDQTERIPVRNQPTVLGVYRIDLTAQSWVAGKIMRNSPGASPYIEETKRRIAGAKMLIEIQQALDFQALARARGQIGDDMRPSGGRRRGRRIRHGRPGAR